MIADPKHKAGQTQLAAQFRKWQAIAPSVESIVSNSPRMAELKPTVSELANLGTTGLAVLNCLSNSQKPSAEWSKNNLKLLNDAEQPAGLIYFEFLPSLRRLFLACDSTNMEQ